MSKIIKNYIYNSIYQILNLIIPIITIPYIAQALGAEGVGINGYITSIGTIFIYIGLLGMDKYASREIAYKRENKDDLDKTFSELIVLRMIMIMIISFVYIIFALDSEYKTLMLIQYIYIVGYLIDISWLYNGLEEFKLTSVRSSIIKLINVICLFIFVKQPTDLWKYIFINSILTFIGNIILYYKIGRYVEFKKVNIKEIYKHLPATIKLFVPQIAIQLYLQIGKVIMKDFVTSTAEIAYYDQADKIVKLPLALITALSTVMFPRMANEFKKNNNNKVKEYVSKSLSFTMLLGMPMAIGVFGISDTLVPWLLGNDFIPTITTIKILSPIIVAICITNVIGDQYLMATNNTKMLTVSYIIGTIVNISINFILIPKYSYIGASISMLITEIIIVFIQLMCVRNVIKIKEIIKITWKYVVAAMIMLIFIVILKNLVINLMMITMIQIALGIIIYFVILYGLKDEFFYYIIEKIIQKKFINKGEHVK